MIIAFVTKKKIEQIVYKQCKLKVCVDDDYKVVLGFVCSNLFYILSAQYSHTCYAWCFAHKKCLQMMHFSVSAERALFFSWRSKCHKSPPNSISSDQLHYHLGLIYFQLGWFAAYQRGTGGASTILRSCRISALTPLRNPNECFSYLYLIQESVSALPSSHVKLNVFLDLKLGFFILFTSFYRVRQFVGTVSSM